MPGARDRNPLNLQANFSEDIISTGEKIQPRVFCSYVQARERRCNEIVYVMLNDTTMAYRLRRSYARIWITVRCDSHKEGKSIVRRGIRNPWPILFSFSGKNDDWAVLFNPDTGDAFGLNPTGVCVWKPLDGKHSIDEMLRVIRRDDPNVPEEASEEISSFVEEISQRGLVTCVEQPHDGREPMPTHSANISGNLADSQEECGQPRSGKLCYLRPHLAPLTLERPAHASVAW
jgi:SynChlorMet cassette protein ScmD